jgi:hypothetical protein
MRKGPIDRPKKRSRRYAARLRRTPTDRVSSTYTRIDGRGADMLCEGSGLARRPPGVCARLGPASESRGAFFQGGDQALAIGRAVAQIANKSSRRVHRAVGQRIPGGDAPKKGATPTPRAGGARSATIPSGRFRGYNGQDH